jgi:hypothetical protein
MPKDRELPKDERSRKIAVAAKSKAGPAKQRGTGGHGDKAGEAGGLIAKLRKPMAPPTRVAADERKYSRARMRERSRRES